MKIRLPKNLYSLSSKTITLLVVFIIIPVCFVLFYSSRQYESIIRAEISDRNIESLSNIEKNINDVLDSMVKISNFIVNDLNITTTFKDQNLSYYERVDKVNRVINNIIDSNLFFDNVKITIFDNKKQVYSNWGLNFNDYEFILQGDLTTKAFGTNGHLVWSGFEPSFIIEEKSNNIKYISLARTIINDVASGENLGVLIISLSEEEFRRVFQKYIGKEDGCFLISGKDYAVLTWTGDDVLYSSDMMEGLMVNVSELQKGAVQKVDGKEYLVNYYEISKMPWGIDIDEWNIVVFTFYNRMTYNLRMVSGKMLFLFAIFVAFLLIAVVLLTQGITRPIKKLNKKMSKFSLDSEISGLDIDRKDEIGHLNQAFYKMSQNIYELFVRLRNEHEVREKYRFESLRAQLNPHFLFNTLNMIRWMAIIRKADNIVESIDALANILKFSMSRGDEIVRLCEEIENIRSYVFIQNNRYGGKYKVDYQIDDEVVDFKVVKFILQPSIENAIIHAFKDREGSGDIKIEGHIEEDKLVLKVRDNGVGMSEDQIRKILSEEGSSTKGRKKVTGLGINIVNERIRQTYGEQYGINIYSTQGEGTIIKYTLPIIAERGEQSAENITC